MECGTLLQRNGRRFRLSTSSLQKWFWLMKYDSFVLKRQRRRCWHWQRRVSAEESTNRHCSRDCNYHSITAAMSSECWVSRNENTASVLFHTPSLLDVITRKR